MVFWKGKRVLITGHTGFKGSWLSLWLQKLGAEVVGYALDSPTTPSLFNLAQVGEEMTSIIADIRDKEKIKEVINKHRPEVVFHLAAQPLVRKSYEMPVETFDINIMGTVNLLDVLRNSNCVRVIINVTSDKCYDNKEWLWGYRETDPLGGYDPYSCSKGCSELITNSYRESYFRTKNIYLASARAGNVIGGGDWAEDRLVPDIIKSFINNKSPIIRNPSSIRPWQHVLEAVCGYMALAQAMWDNGEKYSEAWNFGPDNDHIISVYQLTSKLARLWNNEFIINDLNNNELHEATILKLDSSKAKHRLNWETKLNMEDTLKWTVDWYREFMIAPNNMRDITLRQIEDYDILRRE